MIQTNIIFLNFCCSISSNLDQLFVVIENKIFVSFIDILLDRFMFSLTDCVFKLNFTFCNCTFYWKVIVYSLFFKVKTSIRKSVTVDFSENQDAIKKTSQTSKEQGQSEILGVRKRLSNGANNLNSSFGKQKTYSTVPSLKKAISTKGL